MSQIKVLHIVWSAAIGGIERVVSNLCTAQLNADFVQPAILIAKAEDPELLNFKKLNIPVFNAGFKKGNDSSAEVIKACETAFADYDVLHIHSFNPLIADLAVKSKKKIVYTEHGNFAFGRGLFLKDYYVRYLQKRFLNKHVDFITFNSEFSKKTAEGRFGLSAVKREVVYNGVPSVSLKDQQTNKNTSSGILKVITIGRLATVKRIDRLIKAFAIADYKKMHLTIVGDGPLREELEMLCRNTKTENYIKFAGVRNSLEMMQHADICVFPSQNEAFGLVAIEAYQFGKPVIAFNDAGGLAELINKIEPDLLVNSENELAEMLNSFLINPGKYLQEILKQKRKKFAGEFSIEKMEAALLKIYKHL